MTRAVKRHDEESVERALRVLALCAGNSTEASRRLADADLPVPRSTLQRWRDEQHTDRYQEIRREVVPQVRERAAEKSDEIARAAAEKELAFIAALDPDDMASRDRANALRNLSTTRGISVDVSRKLRDEPDVVIEHRRSGEELVEEIARKFPHLVVDGTAEEIEMPELPKASGFRDDSAAA